MASDFFTNAQFNTTMWNCFITWFYTKKIRYNSKAWLIYENCHACSNTVKMDYIEYNTFIHKIKQAILKEMK